ncbi:DUF3817 domain-containing protein [Dermatophilaceae bacterium Sec6.4]|nr:DUF3817 domain-containing protein [Actinomycetota bacterium]
MSEQTPQVTATAGRTLIDPDKSRKALTFFKIMAVIVGLGLLLLTAQVILKYAFDNGALDWWPQPHGLVYIVYIAATVNLSFKMRWGLLKMVGVILAGCIPFLSFYIERKVSANVEGELTGLAAERSSSTAAAA